jgi:arylsulfatase A-like enzyme
MFQKTQFPGFRGEIETLSPIDQVGGVSTNVTIRMVVGDKDDVTPPALSEAYKTAALRAGKHVTLTELEGEPHDILLKAAVLAELDKRGLAANTIVIFAGDNGASQFRGKGTLYEYGLRVPLMARWPGKVKAGVVSRDLISGEDLAPTLLEACGLKPLPEMTGRSFLKLLRGENHTGRQYVFAERGAHGSGLPTGTAPFDLGRVVIGQRYKLIYNALWQLPYQPVDFNGDAFWKELQQMNKDGKLSPEMSRLYFSPTRPMFELFDLEADPSEFNNLIDSPEHATIARELKAALQEWMILERDFLPLPVPPPPPAQRR